MKIRVLGCSGAIARGSRTTAFLVDHDVLIDAGTGVGDLTLEELAQIDHMLISHSHLDHILAIGLLADSVMRLRASLGRPSIQVHALPETLDALRTHIFNGVIWPDFTRLPTDSQPVLALIPFDVGDELEIAGKQFEVLSACHTVPAVGFALKNQAGWWVYTGDTGPNPDLWRRIAQIKVSHLVIETAFSNEEGDLAQVSQHLCPARLHKELMKFDEGVEVFITHIKPGEIEAVMHQISLFQAQRRIQALHAGQLIDLDHAVP